MGQEPTPTLAPADGLKPEGAPGQTPTSDETNATPEQTPEGKTFDESYVKQLRKEAAESRRELAAVKGELSTLQDRDKTETERLGERASQSEQRASEAESKLIRYEVFAERGLDLDLVDSIAGSTREEIIANADKLAAKFAQRPTEQAKPPGFDGGARITPEQTKPGDQAHNDLLVGLLRPGAQQQ